MQNLDEYDECFPGSPSGQRPVCATGNLPIGRPPFSSCFSRLLPMRAGARGPEGGVGHWQAPLAHACGGEGMLDRHSKLEYTSRPCVRGRGGLAPTIRFH